MDSENYKTSNNYSDLLERLKQGQRIVCFTDGISKKNQDIAIAYAVQGSYYICARGTMYVTAFGLDGLTPEDDFVNQCEDANVRFIPPMVVL